MQRELDMRVVLGLLALVVVVAGFFLYRSFSGGGSAPVSAAQAGLGPPVQPGGPLPTGAVGGAPVQPSGP